MFKDRIDAANQLSKRLTTYQKSENTLVVGIARGGIPLAKTIAAILNLPNSYIIVKKICAPSHDHVAIAAMSETDIVMLNDSMMELLQISPTYFDEQLKEIKEEIETSKQNTLDFKGKTILLVDDGVATGITMKVAIASVMSLGAARVHIVTPIISQGAFRFFQKHIEDITYLLKPLHFHRLEDFYNSFALVEEEVDIFSK